MFRILVGNRTHLDDALKDYKFVKNIFDYINTDSLFSPKKDNVYFLYTKEMNLSTKELKKFDRLVDNLSYDVICVVETQLDKKSAFYKHYKNKLEYVEEFVDKSVKAKAKSFLKTKDIDILKVFATKTKNSNKIESDKRNLASFYVKRKKWVDDLSKYGVIPNKTYKVYLPKLEDKYMPSLIRGCIDGDGWISYKSHQIGFCGNETIVTQIRDYLVSKLNIFNVKILHPEEHLWQITWSGKADIEKIGNYLYKDKEDCFLQRKYNNWIQIIHGNTEVITESKESVTP